MNYMLDKDFLKQLDEDNLKQCYVKIEVLDSEEKPISDIVGRVSTGNININGSSSLRRTASLTFIADEVDNDLTDVDNLLSISKRIALYVGFENNIDLKYDDIIWFKQGIFLIQQPSISHNLGSVTISLSLQDKMCLLNGTMGGGLPTSITFHEYDQLDSEGNVTTLPQLIFDIIQTLVVNYGGEGISNVYITDIPRELKQIVHWQGSKTLYFNTEDSHFTTDSNEVTSSKTPAVWKTYEAGDEIGYTYTSFTYPGELVSNIGDNVCTILDTIVSTLGNYEYFYDVDAHFIFQEKKNYLNTSYDELTVDESGLLSYNPYQLANYGRKNEDGSFTSSADNNIYLINNKNYQVDFSSNSKVEYEFNTNNGLITSISNTPSYENIKNDYHIWGKTDNDIAIHYHVVIKEKPSELNYYAVRFLRDDQDSTKYSGKIQVLDGAKNLEDVKIDNEILSFIAKEDTPQENRREAIKNEEDEFYTVDTKSLDKVENKSIWSITQSDIYIYQPQDWRVELCFRGMYKNMRQIRPDIYEQELMDLLNLIYDFTAYNKETQSYGKYKFDILNKPNYLPYFIDFIEPSTAMGTYSVDSIGPRILSHQEDKINKIYNLDIPDIVIINKDDDEIGYDEYGKELKNEKGVSITFADYLRDKCGKEGQAISQVDKNIYSNIEMNSSGYTALETFRDLLYQNTSFAEAISISSIPIYYLDVNRRITVNDKVSGISGDYIVNSISLPLNGQQTMSISASRAYERI